MISGAHAIIYSNNGEADRAFLRDVLKLPFVDVGHGWLIFGLPPSEIAIHPHDKKPFHELYLICDDINKLVVQMAERKIACSPVSDQGWGLLSTLTLPGGGKLGVYEPRHARPKNPVAKATAKTKAKSAKAPAKPSARKKVAAKPAAAPAKKKPAAKTKKK